MIFSGSFTSCALSLKWFRCSLVYIAPRFNTFLLPCCCQGFASGGAPTRWSANGGVPARWYSKPKIPTERTAKRLEKLGLGPDGKPLPIPNTKNIFPRMYKVLLVNQDGSTYTIQHRHPYHILTLPLDPSTLTEEQRAAREKKKMAAKARKYVEEEEDEEEESWDQSKYRDLIKDL